MATTGGNESGMDIDERNADSSEPKELKEEEVTEDQDEGVDGDGEDDNMKEESVGSEGNNEIKEEEDGDNDDNGIEGNSVKQESIGKGTDVAEEDLEDEDLDADEDPVEHIFDLYLNRELEEQLYMLRYPLRSVVREPSRTSGARFKPKNKVLETSVDVLDAFPGDDPQQGNSSFELPYHTEHMNKQERNAYTAKVREQKFRSVRLNTNERCYAAAIVDKDSKSVTLVPLQGIYDMLPIIQTGFESQDGPIEGEGAPDNATKNAKAAEAMAQPVALQRESTHDPNRQRFHKVKQQLNEEPWVDLCVHERNTEQASAGFAKLRYTPPEAKPNTWDDLSDDEEMADNGGASAKEPASVEKAVSSKGSIPAGNAFKLSSMEFLNVLAPKIRQDKEEVVEAVPEKAETVEEHIRSQLIRLSYVTTQMIETSLNAAFGNLDAKVLRALPETIGSFAHLIHGAWYLRSDIYNEYRFGTAQAGDDIADYQRNWVRNIILAIFCEAPKGQVSRASIAKEVKGAMSKSMLDSVAVYNGEKKLWQLRLMDEKYSHRHEQFAEAHRNQLREMHCEGLQRLHNWPLQKAHKYAYPTEGDSDEDVKDEGLAARGPGSKAKVKKET
mmetsp:Transcript_22456/g.44105  ORF Transcript_22456/g.44105 Transcript_22456/m.44105 type:complete len:612 (-) Transcript_22456:8-1843(-)